MIKASKEFILDWLVGYNICSHVMFFFRIYNIHVWHYREKPLFLVFKIREFDLKLSRLLWGLILFMHIWCLVNISWRLLWLMCWLVLMEQSRKNQISFCFIMSLKRWNKICFFTLRSQPWFRKMAIRCTNFITIWLKIVYKC